MTSFLPEPLPGAARERVVERLFLADYLEPGRKRRRKERARLAERVPPERDDR